MVGAIEKAAGERGKKSGQITNMRDRQSSSFLYLRPSFPSKNYSLPCQMVTRLISCISGHGPFAYHQSLIEPSIDPIYCFCSLERKENFNHLMHDYPALVQRRADLFSQFQLPADFDWTPTDILSFISHTRLAEIFELVEAPSRRDTSLEISVRSGSYSEDEEIF